MHVYRWDLDKTYLDTDFDSLRGLVRSATEPAHRKRALPGAAALMRALGKRPDHRICIVSGSPVQLRSKLARKLELDGVLVHSLVLKDSLGHLKRGQLRAIKGQFGYKLPELLAERALTDVQAAETLFGDDAEVDALVYSVYADAVAGTLTPAEVSRIMEAAGAYPERIDLALNHLARIPAASAVRQIFIRLERGYPAARFRPLGHRVIPVHSWWQAALILWQEGVLDGSDVREVLESICREGTTPFAAASLAQDLVRHGRVSVECFAELQGPEDVLVAVRRAVDRTQVVPHPTDPGLPDYMQLVRHRV